MSTYINKVNEIVGLLLEAEEQEVNLEVILDSDLAYDVAKELQYTFGKKFCMDSEDDFEIDLSENDILGVAVSVYEDGEVEYFLQPVMNDNGETYGDEASDIVFVQDEIVDCLDLDAFDCEVVILEEMEDDEISEECFEDCSNCPYAEDYDEEEDVVEVLFDELMSSINELEKDEDLVENILDLIFDKLSESYDMGIEDGYDIAVEEIQDTLDDMRF